MTVPRARRPVEPVSGIAAPPAKTLVFRRMPSVGDKFRAERERRGLTVHQAADGTNIKTDHIRALEAGEWRSFPAPVYIRGFARTYAKYLRLDDRAIVDEVVLEVGNIDDLDTLPGAAGGARGPLDFVMLQLSRVKWTIVFPLLVGAALIVGGWLAFRAWQAAPRQDPLGQLGSGLVAPRTRPPGTLPLPTNSAVPRPSR